MTEPTTTTAPAKRGAPAGNTNAQTHGLRGKWLTLGKLPPGHGYTRRVMGVMAAELARAVLENGVALGPFQMARINSATRHEARAMLARKHLVTTKDLTLAQQLELTKTISDASEARDRAIKDLGLMAPPSDRDPWAVVDQAGKGGSWQAHPDGMHETATAGDQPAAASPDTPDVTAPDSQAGEVTP